ncbi:MAG: helix-turn-helix transcriptional regulator [Betaproteobacteria bacterium]
MRDKRYVDFGGSLRKLREKQGLSQEAVAKAAGIGRSTLVHLEGGADARLSRIQAVAKVLGADIEPVAERSELLERRQARLQQALRAQFLQNAHLRIAARLLSEDPSEIEALEDARRMVSLWERERVCSPFYIEAWKKLLSGPPKKVGKGLAQIDEKWEPALLQNTPFGSRVRQQA